MMNWTAFAVVAVVLTGLTALAMLFDRLSVILATRLGRDKYQQFIYIVLAVMVLGVSVFIGLIT